MLEKVEIRFLVQTDSQGSRFQLEFTTGIMKGKTWLSGFVKTYYWPSRVEFFTGKIDDELIDKILKWVRHHGVTEEKFLFTVEAMLLKLKK